jgi:hypothetical protein
MPGPAGAEKGKEKEDVDMPGPAGAEKDKEQADTDMPVPTEEREKKEKEKEEEKKEEEKEKERKKEEQAEPPSDQPPRGRRGPNRRMGVLNACMVQREGDLFVKVRETGHKSEASHQHYKRTADSPDTDTQMHTSM